MEINYPTKTFKIHQASVAFTAANAERELNLPDEQNSYRLIRLYDDGTAVVSDVARKNIYMAIAYNAIYRNQSTLIVDGTVCYVGYDESLIPAHIKGLINSGTTLMKNPKKYEQLGA